MASFSKKLPSFSFSKDTSGNGNDKEDEDKDRDNKRRSRSLFSSLNPSSSSSSTSTAGNRSPSPYAGRLKYKQGRKGGRIGSNNNAEGDVEGSNNSNKATSPRRRSRGYATSDTETEYAGATSSAYNSEAESEADDGALSRVLSNTPSIAASTSGATHSSIINSQSSRGHQFSLSKDASSEPPQAGKGTPQNAFSHDSGDEDENADNSDKRQGDSQKTAQSRLPSTSAPPDGTGTLGSARGTANSTLETIPTSARGAGSGTSIQHAEYAYGDWGSSGDDDEEEDDDGFDLDPTVAANTEANSGALTAAELLNAKPGLLAGYSYSGDGDDGDEDIDAQDAFIYDENEEQHDWPNLVKSPASPFAPVPGSSGSTSVSASSSRNPSSSFGTSSLSSSGIPPSATASRGRHPDVPLIASRPVYERNRCTITLTHGDPDSHVIERGNISAMNKYISSQAGSAPPSVTQPAQSAFESTSHRHRKKRKGKTYVVASDLSEESYYAIEWAIGTVLRSGDDLLFVTVMETDSKLDPEDGTAVDKTTKIRAQQERQTRAMQLSREATALLERTRLHVRVVCQAIHAKNARHMLIDLIDYFSPTLVIIGSRGLSRLKGIILGSVSHYLIQKSSAPVMVTRRRLKPLRRPPRPISDLQRRPRVGSLANATIDVESHAGMVHQSHASPAGATDEAGNEIVQGQSFESRTSSKPPAERSPPTQ